MISELKLNNFRCFDSTTITLSPGINFFYGPNGSGKTSILEAVYMCSSGKSFKSSNIKSLISFNKEFFSIGAYDSIRGYTLQITKNQEKPILLKINDTKSTTSNLIKEFPATAIHNSTFSFANASPDFRRKVLDRSLFVSNSAFSEIWFGFYRSLKQRNGALKKGLINNIDTWNKKVSQEGDRLDSNRVSFFKETVEELDSIFNKINPCKITDKLKHITIEFFSGWNKEKTLYEVLFQNQQKDILSKVTTRGPHKADIKILMNGMDAKQILSRGEQKILSIFWCCAQNEVLKKKYNINATLIIDDIKSELDDSTFGVFLNLLKFIDNQVIFSCIDDHFSSKMDLNYKDFKKFHVEQLR
jgi:DNA replication and repair protein RecF